MAEALNLQLPNRPLPRRSSLSTKCSSSISLLSSQNAIIGKPNPKWTTLREELNCQGRHSCFFSDDRKQYLARYRIFFCLGIRFLFNIKPCVYRLYLPLNLVDPKYQLTSPHKEEARKALESALGGKKIEFVKWNKEIQKREEMDGGAAGCGGWFGGGGWFGWFGGEHFWEDAQQASLAIIGIISLYLLIVKGNVMFAVISNSLLFLLRGLRSWFTLISDHFSGSRRSLPTDGPGQMAKEAYQSQLSVKERVVRKWGMD